jgi:hypothetical protein
LKRRRRRKATFLVDLGWPNHPMGSGSITPWQKKKKNSGFWPLGVAKPPPMALGSGSATPNGQNPQNKILGFAHEGGSATPRSAGLGVGKPPLWA